MIKCRVKKKLKEIEAGPDLERVKSYSGAKAFADILADDRTIIPFSENTTLKNTGEGLATTKLRQLFSQNLFNIVEGSDEARDKLVRKLAAGGFKVVPDYVVSGTVLEFMKIFKYFDNNCEIDLTNNTITKYMGANEKPAKTKFTAFLESLIKIHETSKIETNNDTFKSISRFMHGSISDKDDQLGSLQHFKETLPDPKYIRTLYNLFNTVVITPMGTKKFILLTRNPLDVLRMADFKSLQSCHSPPYPSKKKPSGKFYFCAIQESEGGGAVAYLVSGNTPNDISQDQEVLEDPDRGIKGLNPISRIRIRQVRYKSRDGDTKILAIPEQRIYGTAENNFQVKLVEYFRNNQQSTIDEISQALLKDASSVTFELLGGSYLDTELSDLVSLFLNHGQIDSSKIKVQDRISANRDLTNWQIRHLFDDLINDLFERVGNGDLGNITSITLSKAADQGPFDAAEVRPVKDRFTGKYYVEVQMILEQNYDFDEFRVRFVNALNIGIDDKSAESVKAVDSILSPINHTSATDEVESFIYDIVFNNDNESFQRYVSGAGMDIDYDEDNVNFNIYMTLKLYSENIDFPVGEITSAFTDYFTPEYIASTISKEKKEDLKKELAQSQIREQFKKSLPWRR
jgi:hypothetical protein